MEEVLYQRRPARKYRRDDRSRQSLFCNLSAITDSGTFSCEKATWGNVVGEQDIPV